MVIGEAPGADEDRHRQALRRPGRAAAGPDAGRHRPRRAPRRRPRTPSTSPTSCPGARPATARPRRPRRGSSCPSSSGISSWPGRTSSSPLGNTPTKALLATATGIKRMRGQLGAARGERPGADALLPPRLPAAHARGQAAGLARPAGRAPRAGRRDRRGHDPYPRLLGHAPVAPLRRARSSPRRARPTWSSAPATSATSAQGLDRRHGDAAPGRWRRPCWCPATPRAPTSCAPPPAPATVLHGEAAERAGLRSSASATPCRCTPFGDWSCDLVRGRGRGAAGRHGAGRRAGRALAAQGRGRPHLGRRLGRLDGDPGGDRAGAAAAGRLRPHPRQLGRGRA